MRRFLPLLLLIMGLLLLLPTFFLPSVTAIHSPPEVVLTPTGFDHLPVITQNLTRLSILLGSDNIEQGIALDSGGDADTMVVSVGSPALEARKTITLLSKYFGLRTCQEKIPGRRKRACLEFDLGLCSAPCVALISKEEYKKNVQNAVLFLQGNVDSVIKNISQLMKASAANQDFEQAAHWRDLIKTLGHIKIKPKLISVGKENLDIFGFSKDKEECVICVFIKSRRTRFSLRLLQLLQRLALLLRLLQVRLL